MHTAFGDYLTVKMGEFLYQPRILQQDGAALSGICEFWLSATGRPLAEVNRFFSIVKNVYYK